jgi:hypothetical protein
MLATMSRPARRTITVADLVVLVGAAGIGMGCLLAVNRTLLANWLTRTSVVERLAAGWNPASWLITLTDVIAYAMPLLGGWSAVLPLLRLRSPRPRLRRALGQAGIVATLAAWTGGAVGFAAMLCAYGLAETKPRTGAAMPFWMWSRKFLAGQMLGITGLAVAAAWLGLLLAGRWRRPEDWIDRFGRILGCCWIVVGFVWAMTAYHELM